MSIQLGRKIKVRAFGKVWTIEEVASDQVPASESSDSEASCSRSETDGIIEAAEMPYSCFAVAEKARRSL